MSGFSGCFAKAEEQARVFSLTQTFVNGFLGTRKTKGSLLNQKIPKTAQADDGRFLRQQSCAGEPPETAPRGWKGARPPWTSQPPGSGWAPSLPPAPIPAEIVDSLLIATPSDCVTNGNTGNLAHFLNAVETAVKTIA